MSNPGLFPDLDAADKEAREAEFYPTPAWCVRALLDAADPPLPPVGVWVEPAAGEGAIVQAVEHAHPGRRKWLCVEKRKDAAEQCDRNVRGLGENTTVVQRDFLAPWGPWQLGDIGAQLDLQMSEAEVFITNPPFSLALEFAQACLKLGPRAHIAMLLRLAFTETPKRGAFLRKHPCDLYVLDRRPQFKGGSKTSDKWAYAWVVWGLGRGGRWFSVES